MRGQVRQGDSLSPLLYILCAEVLSTNIRNDNPIKGFLLPGASGKQFKVSQYADDSTCFVKDFFFSRSPIAELLCGQRPQKWSPIPILRGMLVIFYGHGKRNGSWARAPYIRTYIAFHDILT